MNNIVGFAAGAGVTEALGAGLMTPASPPTEALGGDLPTPPYSLTVALGAGLMTPPSSLTEGLLSAAPSAPHAFGSSKSSETCGRSVGGVMRPAPSAEATGPSAPSEF